MTLFVKKAMTRNEEIEDGSNELAHNNVKVLWTSSCESS